MPAAAGLEERHQRQQAAAQSVPQDHAQFEAPLAAGGTDEILGQHVEHAAAREPRYVGGVGQTEGDRRQDAVARLLPSRRR